jgi:hypothetical protein
MGIRPEAYSSANQIKLIYRDDGAGRNQKDYAAAGSSQMFALKMDSRDSKPAVFGLGYVNDGVDHKCAVWEFGDAHLIDYQYSVACDDGKYFIDAAFTDQWKADPSDADEQSSILAIDDHYQFDASTYKQSIYFMSRFKTADSANSYTTNHVVEVDDTTSASSTTRTMKMVSIDTWNVHSDGRQEFMV